ncbi:hypothetical protein BU25DRAFT_73901 [Macroventuria anomochaeta]|uniref:Uncharacterized protein n=1 Tax=Macroventuria anomochaeta TaxID=301207 RepID=A0ACB6S0C5_9PLEO|nr:uncharacterized protein BU25DRAFT_73901 [Macroventuria anomochaeta]KAF2626858.1 hypothetical protein BU25DRAFT_73901 [Macroventuria anomochaeta]
MVLRIISPHYLTMMENIDRLMHASWFAQSGPVTERAPFDDATIRDIATVLRNEPHESWGRVPSIFIVLRTINQPHLVQSFLDEELTNLWFPCTLPFCLTDQTTRDAFLTAQRLVLTKALDLERENGKHRHFQNPGIFHSYNFQSWEEADLELFTRYKATSATKKMQENALSEASLSAKTGKFWKSSRMNSLL